MSKKAKAKKTTKEYFGPLPVHIKYKSTDPVASNLDEADGAANYFLPGAKLLCGGCGKRGLTPQALEKHCIGATDRGGCPHFMSKFCVYLNIKEGTTKNRAGVANVPHFYATWQTDVLGEPDKINLSEARIAREKIQQKTVNRDLGKMKTVNSDLERINIVVNNYMYWYSLQFNLFYSL